MAGELYLGIDIGSTASKCVVVDAAGEVRGTGVYPSGAGTKGPQTAFDAALLTLSRNVAGSLGIAVGVALMQEAGLAAAYACMAAASLLILLPARRR